MVLGPAQRKRRCASTTAKPMKYIPWVTISNPNEVGSKSLSHTYSQPCNVQWQVLGDRENQCRCAIPLQNTTNTSKTFKGLTTNTVNACFGECCFSLWFSFLHLPFRVLLATVVCSSDHAKPCPSSLPRHLQEAAVFCG